MGIGITSLNHASRAGDVIADRAAHQSREIRYPSPYVTGEKGVGKLRQELAFALRKVGMVHEIFFLLVGRN